MRNYVQTQDNREPSVLYVVLIAISYLFHNNRDKMFDTMLYTLLRWSFDLQAESSRQDILQEYLQLQQNVLRC